MWLSIIYGLFGIIALILVLGVVFAVNQVVASAQMPLKKYQATSNDNPDERVWFLSMASLIITALVIGINIRLDSMDTDITGLHNGIAMRIIRVILLIFLFAGMSISSYESRRNVKSDDPKIKIGTFASIINTTAITIPFILLVYGSNGIASVIAPGSSGIVKAITLLITLGIPASICSSLLLLFSRSTSSYQSVLFTLLTILSMLIFPDITSILKTLYTNNRV